jgi:hypothetical protein
LTRITSPWTGGNVDYTYDAKNRLTKQKAAKFETDIVYNARDQVTDQHTYTRNQPTQTLIRFSNIAYLGVGVPRSATITQPQFSSTAPSRSGSIEWFYDARYNLVRERRFVGSTVLYDTDAAGTASFDGANNPTNLFGRGLSFNGNSDVATTGFAFDAQGNPTTYDGQGVSYNKADQFAGVTGRYSVISYDDGRTASKTTTANKVTYFLYDLEGRVVAELGGANSAVALGSVYAAYSYGPGGLTSRFSGLTGEYGAFAFDIAGNVAVRQRQVDTDMDASEVYDAYGRVYERFNVQGANPDPVTDPIGSLAQFGNRTEEEDRAAVAARYVRQIDGELYDPATGRQIKSDTAIQWQDPFTSGMSDFEIWFHCLPDRPGSVGASSGLELFLPVWGSGRQAYNDFQNQRYGWAAINGGLTISVGGSIVKGAWKAIAAATARSVAVEEAPLAGIQLSKNFATLLENEAAKELGGVARKSIKGFGRVMDVLVGSHGYEIKSGFVPYSKAIQAQIGKDARILAEEQLRRITWQFYVGRTGRSGIDPRVIEALERAGIAWKIMY